MGKTRIVLTGGGTAGHVTPNIALLDLLDSKNWDVAYIGSKSGVEKQMIEGVGIPYYNVRCGKLRRYFSWQNFLDPFNLLIGIFQAIILLKKLGTNIIFSKGGFVSLPVVIAGYLCRIPVVIHESDMTPGLANKLSFPFSRKICVNFSETPKYIKNSAKVEVTGTPIRESLFKGSKEKGLEICGFNAKKPCLLVVGGSQGSQIINENVRAVLPEITKTYQVIHICGHGKLAKDLVNTQDYYQIEYANLELADFFAASDLLISRSGANSLCEILALRKPHVLIPLSGKSSRGDQIQNARHFAKQGISIELEEGNLNQESLLKAVADCEQNATTAVAKMKKLNVLSSGQKIFNILNSFVRP